MNAEERAARLAVAAEFGSLHIERPRRPGLVDCDVDRTDTGVVHANVRDEVAARIDDGDVHRAAEGAGFGFSALNDLPGGFEADGEHFDHSHSLAVFGCHSVISAGRATRR